MFIAKTDIGVTRPSRYITANVIPSPIAPMATGAATETTVLKMSSRTSTTTGKVIISARLRSRPVYSLMSEKIAEPPGYPHVQFDVRNRVPYLGHLVEHVVQGNVQPGNGKGGSPIG